MRIFVLAVGLFTLAPAAGRADDAAAILDKAVQATATSDLMLNRLAVMVRTDRGTLFLPGEPAQVERTCYLRRPDRLKYDATMTTAGQKQTMVIALNGPLGWQQPAGQV